jgi:hypothetical protein
MKVENSQIKVNAPPRVIHPLCPDHSGGPENWLWARTQLTVNGSPDSCNRFKWNSGDSIFASWASHIKSPNLLILWNCKSKPRTPRISVHPKIIKPKAIPNIWGCKITKKSVTWYSCVIPSKKSGRKHPQIRRTKNSPKIPLQIAKNKNTGESKRR